MARTSAIKEEVWANAIHAVLVDKMSLRNAAQKFGVHHMSLHRRIKGSRGDKKPDKRESAVPGGARAAAAPPASFPQMQPGMSMVNMMQMNMMTTEKKPARLSPAPSASQLYAAPSRAPHLASHLHHQYEGGAMAKETSPSSMHHARQPPMFPGIENASSNVSAWSKAVHAVEMGHLDIHQAAQTFQLDVHALNDHFNRTQAHTRRPSGDGGAPPDIYLTQGESHGVLRVLSARADVGVKMDYDELVDLVRRVLLVRPGPNSAAASSGYFEHVLGSFLQQNEPFLRSVMDLHAGSSPQGGQPMSPAQQHHHQQQQHQHQQLQQHRPASLKQERQHLSDASEQKYPAPTYLRQMARPAHRDDRYSPSSNLLIASNKISKPQPSAHEYYGAPPADARSRPSHPSPAPAGSEGPSSTRGTARAKGAESTDDIVEV